MLGSLPTLVIATAVVTAVATAPANSAEFGMADVERMAEKMAATKHVPPARVGDAFLDLNYDTFRLIAQRNENAMWRDQSLDTWMEFFPAGFLYEYPVKIHVVEDDQVQDVAFGDQWFQFRGESAPLAKADGGGFAGLRLLTQLPGNEHKTEYLSFLGASYFRGIGSQQWYGSSARGLAVDIGLGTPEEFPRFIEFWIEKPAAKRQDNSVRMWALLDSPGVVGAYEFTIHPGEETRLQVTAKVWQRHGLQKLALAPITSMFMWNEQSHPTGDTRPEVHDADTLVVHRNQGDWVTRPLTRPEKPHVESWKVDQLLGFGLLQTERDFDKYRDEEAHYHLRPNVWVEPGKGDVWRDGRVELLELDAKHEGVDNIGAYYVVDPKKHSPEQPIEFEYELTFGTKLPAGFAPREAKVAAHK
ncbi:glucan biosynthesis protein [Aeoliella mucimassa]|uniref:Glucans biosynthesis protein G n=1 Tax=Aeoliella mucimassa TaxID=2527972 RepID=A0A518AJH6_9BACT|nr:glucan biosynthesis protein [Aeoliella mucimassa]QDU54875.1 Glucans biosynthesis protein G precursor [Aeoliella mucimassa]